MTTPRMFTPDFKLTFGADPEVFVVNNLGHFVSAGKYAPGTKGKPERVPNGHMQLDGTAFEFNVDPTPSIDEFISRTASVQRFIQEEVLPKGFSLKAQPFVDFGEREWAKIPASEKELGCTPDYDAYSGFENVINPYYKDRATQRTGSGHIHFGWRKDGEMDEGHINDCRLFVVLCESVFARSPYESIRNTLLSRQRRGMYGNFGAFRPKPYGVEWRTPDNSWLNHKSLMKRLLEDIQKVCLNPAKEMPFFASIHGAALGVSSQEFPHPRPVNNAK